MRSKFLLSAFAVGILTASPIVIAQTMPPAPAGSQPMPGEPEDPANPNPVPDPSNPTPPVTEPLPPEMPMPAGEAQQMPPMQPQPEVIDRSLPPGPPATMPSAGANAAMSGSTTGMMMAPQPATKEYPPCSRTLQDNCRNPGEGPKRMKKPR